MSRTKRPADSKKIRAIQGHLDEHLVAFHQTNTLVAEQYRKLSIEIIRAGLTRELRTLLITSAMPEEGKTTTALNLAITMAASGGEQGALLVETDLRKPRVEKMLGTYPECGLTDYLLGDVDFSRIFVNTQVPGLTVVHAGRRARNPNALLSSKKMEQFLQTVSSQAQYRYVILDSSPVLLTSDPQTLISHVDTTILVVHAKKTIRDFVAQAIEILGIENILGCIFNSMTASSSYYYNYLYYSKYYEKDRIS